MTRPRPSGAARLSRRSLLRGVGALGAATAFGGLAACSRGEQDTSDPAPSPAQDTSDADGVVRWSSWPLYLDGAPASATAEETAPTLAAFQEATGLTAEHSTGIEDNVAWWAANREGLAAGEDVGADLVVVTDWMAARLVGLGYAQELAQADLPNRGNVRAELADAAYDPGREYTLPWQSGLTGIAWDQEQLPGGLRNVADLWRSPLRGRVVLLTEMRDTVGMIMRDNGVDVTGDWGDDEFLGSLDVLQAQLDTGQVRQVRDNGYVEDLASGAAVAAVAWSGDVVQLNLREGRDRFAFLVPDRGGLLWHDDLVVPVGSPHRRNASRLIDHYYDPAVAAQVAAAVRYVPPVEGAREAMESVAPELVDDPLLFPTEQLLGTVQVFRPLSEAEETRYATEFAKVVGA